MLDPKGEVEPTDAPAPGALIGGRYRVLRRLGRGGMASVYEAVDEATSRQIALKSLHSRRASDAHAARLFELEFYTLSQLAHPRIVAVHDYHKTPEGAFYTMELLAGDDLGQQQLLPWKAVCAVLCDVCLALSLLHSRRLVHRDVTPRNIRLASNGKAKLIDFGAMVRFGTHARAVGTPPFTPPEAIHAQPLDGRADLYAVGATAYYALTGRHAYPARTLANLRNAWRSQPALPSRYAPEIPPELDQLVMALLSLAASRRPPSAGAVIERLTAIAGIRLEEQQQVERAFLSTPSLVGREAALRTIRRQIMRAAHGRGSTLFVTGPRGVGRSRMIDACVLDAKLTSALVLRTDVENRGGEFAGARALLDQLATERAGETEALLRPHAAVLGALWPTALGAPPEATALDQPATRPLMQQALLTVLLEASHDTFVMIACDDVDDIDEPTRALIALLAEHAPRRRLVVAVAAESETAASDIGGASLLHSAEPLELAPLSPEDSEHLLISTFGDVPNVRMLASRLHEVSGGLPAETMQLAQHLLDRDVIRFCDGRWLLPSSLEREVLPSSASAVLHARFAQLDEPARMLAQAIALSAKHVVTLDDCGTLLGSADWPQLLACLDTLVTAQVLQVAGDGYALNQRRWASLLLAALDAPVKTVLHARVADMFAQQPEGGAFHAAAHRLAAGDASSAIDMLLALVTRGREHREIPSRLSPYTHALPAGWRDTLENAIAAAERLGRPQRECFALRQLLLRCLSAGTNFRPDAARSVVEPLRRDSGLLDYEALGDGTPREQRLAQALKQAQARYDTTPDAERGLPPAEAIRTLVATITQVIGMSGASADFDFLSSMPSLAPLASLSPAIEAVQRNLESTCHLFAGRYEQARDGYVAILTGMENSAHTAMPHSVRKYMQLAVTFALAGVETTCGLPEVGERLDMLERDPMFEVNAWQLRTVLALRRGDEQAAAVCERKCERLRIRNAPVQFFDGADAWYHLVAYAEIGDVARVHQCLERIEPMAARFPGWRVTPSYARGQMLLLRGDAEAAAEVFAEALERRPGGQFASWAPIVRGYLTALAECGRIQEARQRGALLLEQARAIGLTVQIADVHFGIAAVELHGGDHDAALEHVRAIETIRARWPLGRVFGGATAELRARIALARRDREGFRLAARACDAAFVSSGHPILISRHQRLLHEAERVGILSATERRAALTETDSETTTMTRSNPERANRLRALVACDNAKQRLDRALSFMLGRDAGAAHAMLYLIRDGEPELAAHFGLCPDPERMQALVADFVRGELEDTSHGAFDPDDMLTSTIDEHAWIGPSGARFMPVLLSHGAETGAVVTGVLVLAVDGERRVDDPLLSDLSAALVEAGDVAPMAG